MSIDHLIAARESLEATIATRMAKAAADTLHPTHSEGGRSTDHTGLLAELRAQLEAINAMIIKRRGPVQISTHLLS